eukprot:gene5749-7152_t
MIENQYKDNNNNTITQNNSNFINFSNTDRLSDTHPVLIINPDQKDQSSDDDSDREDGNIQVNHTDNTTTTTTTTTTATTTPTTIVNKCPTCSSVAQGSGLLSKDLVRNNVYYLSTHQPSNNSYSIIRNACVRSLSCEAVPGREGPVLISSNDGYFLSYMFKINDSRARGSARWYGFLFILGETSSEEMKKRTNIVFEKERSQQSQSSTVLSNIYRRGTRSIPLKPLPELIEDPGKAPVIDEQIGIIDELKSNFIQSSVLNSNDPLQQLIFLQDKFFPIDEELITSLGQVSKILGENAVSALIYNVIAGNQVIVRGSSEKLVHSLVDILKDLIPSECCSMCYYSDSFKEIWECNLLGLNSNAIIPRHLDREVIAIVDIEYYDKTKEPDDIDDPSRSTIEISFRGPRYTTSLGLSIESVLKLNLPTHIEKLYLKTIKDEWIKIGDGSYISVLTLSRNVNYYNMMVLREYVCSPFTNTRYTCNSKLNPVLKIYQGQGCTGNSTDLTVPNNYIYSGNRITCTSQLPSRPVGAFSNQVFLNGSCQGDYDYAQYIYLNTCNRYNDQYTSYRCKGQNEVVQTISNNTDCSVPVDYILHASDCPKSKDVSNLVYCANNIDPILDSLVDYPDFDNNNNQYYDQPSFIKNKDRHNT